MFSVKGYFDGHNYITDGNVAVKPNQRVIITVLDDPSEESVSKGSAFRTPSRKPQLFIINYSLFTIHFINSLPLEEIPKI